MPHCRPCASFRRWQCRRVAIGALFVSLVVAHSAVQKASAQAVPGYQIDTDFSLVAQSTAPILAENYLSGSIVRVTHTIDLPNAVLPGARYFWSFKIDERTRFLLSEGGFIGTTAPLALTNVLPESLDLSDWLIVEGLATTWSSPPTASDYADATCTKSDAGLPALDAFGSDDADCFKVRQADNVTIFKAFDLTAFTPAEQAIIANNALAFTFYLRNQTADGLAVGLSLYPFIGYTTETTTTDTTTGAVDFRILWQSGAFPNVDPDAWTQYVTASTDPISRWLQAGETLTGLVVGMSVANSRLAEYQIWGAQLLDQQGSSGFLPEEYPFFPNEGGVAKPPVAPVHVKLDQVVKHLMTIGYSNGTDPPASAEDCTYTPSDPDSDGSDPDVTYVCLVGFGGLVQGGVYKEVNYSLPEFSLSYRIRIE